MSNASNIKSQVELLQEENKLLKQQAVVDAQNIYMLVTFVDRIQYLVAAMPTFMRHVEKILDYDEDTQKLRTFLRKYQSEKL